MNKIKNIDSETHTWAGMEFLAGAEYLPDKSESIAFANSNPFLSDLVNGKAEFYLDNVLVSNIGSIIDILKGQQIQISSIPAFASKTFDGKKLYKRVVGIRNAIVTGSNVINWSNSFPWVKFMEIQFFNCQVGDYVDLEVYDDALGTYSTVANYKLNQFGFTANLSDAFYSHKSEFDADIYYGIIIRMTYHSISDKTVGINFVMNEVKS